MEFSNCSVVLNRITDEEIRRLCAPVRENESVTFAGCGMELPNCTVVLSRITDEEIRHFCTPGSSTESANEVQDKAGLKTRKRTRCGGPCKKIRSGKRVAAKIENANEFEFYKRKRGFINRKMSGSLSNFSWSSDETESEREKRKKKVKRRRKLKKIREMRESSVNNAFEAVVNVHSSRLNSDANSNLQSRNPSKYDLHQVERTKLDTSANHLIDEQIDNTGQSSGIVSDPELFYSYLSFEDIPLSTLKNMSNLEYKNTLSFFNREIQFSGKKKANSVRRKRKRRLKISSLNEKPGSNGDSENFAQLKKNTIEVKQLDGSIEKNEVDVIFSPLLTTFKESEVTFPSYHDSGGLQKSSNYNWNNGMSFKFSKGEFCASLCYSGMDNLPPINCNTNKCLTCNENGEIKRKTETESQVSKIFKESKLREYFIEKERETSLEVNELDGKSYQLTKEGMKEVNSSNKMITNNTAKIFVKTNELNEKSNHPKSQNDDETIIVSSKQNQSGQSPKHLIVNKMVEDYQTVQTLDKTILHDTRKDIKINNVNTTHMEKEPYIYKFSFSKGVDTDNISLTKSDLKHTSPPIYISIDVNKWKLKLGTKQANSNVSFKSDQNDISLYLQHRYKQLVGNQGKVYQFKESFGQKTADNHFDLSNFQDVKNKYHLQDKCEKLDVLEKLKSIKSCKLYDIKKTPESTDINDASIFLYSSPVVSSNVKANYLYTQENFQNKILPHTNLKVFTSSPQFDDKTHFYKIVPYVENVTKASTTKLSEIPPLMTSSGLPCNTFFATDIPINENANTILPCENNSSPVCSFTNPSIPYLCPERYFLTKIPTYSIKKAKMSDFASCDSVNAQNSEINVSNVYSVECFENMNSHHTEFNNRAPVRLDININDLNSRANGTNMPIERNSCLLSNIEREPISEMYSKNVAELSTNDSLKQACKASENVLSATDILEVVAKLAIADLEKKPHSHLQAKIAIGKALVKKLLSKERITLKLKDLIKSIQYDLHVLNIAVQYLHFYGSFSKVSEHFLKDYRISDPVKE